MKRIKVKPSKENSIISFVICCIFVIVGIVKVIPIFGSFGMIWTGMTAIMTIVSAKNAFTDKGIAVNEIVVEEDYNKKENKEEDPAQKLEKLKELYDKNLITHDEYERKRKEIIERI